MDRAGVYKVIYGLIITPQQHHSADIKQKGCYLEALLHDRDDEGQELVTEHGGQDVQACCAALAQVPPIDLVPVRLAARVPMGAGPASCELHERCQTPQEHTASALILLACTGARPQSNSCLAARQGKQHWLAM